jgi:hypothetical protein
MGKKKHKHALRIDPRHTVYRFTSPAFEQRIVLAMGTWSAVGVLLQWCAANDIGEVPFTIEPGWGASLSEIGRQHLEEARARCEEPSLLTRYRAATGWTLSSPLIDERDDPE